jgi:hypothetical protein
LRSLTNLSPNSPSSTKHLQQSSSFLFLQKPNNPLLENNKNNKHASLSILYFIGNKRKNIVGGEKKTYHKMVVLD